MDQKPIIFVDSNYWIYLFDKTTIEHELVKKHFNILYDEAVLAINTVVMMEVMHYLVKRLGSEIAKEIADEALQIHGGYGLIKGTQIERFYRDQRLLQIGEGTSEIQRLVIARKIGAV